MIKKYYKHVLSLFLVVSFSTILLSYLHSLTAPIIQENQIIRENEIILELFPNATLTEVDFQLSNQDIENGIISVIKADNNYVFKAKSIGLYAGEVTNFIVVIDENGFFSNFKIISSEDTDYIDKVDAEQFKSRFINKEYDVEFNGADMITRATNSANPISDTIKSIGDLYERVIVNE